jgi:hypothetical protein
MTGVLRGKSGEGHARTACRELHGASSHCKRLAVARYLRQRVYMYPLTPPRAAAGTLSWRTQTP